MSFLALRLSNTGTCGPEVDRILALIPAPGLFDRTLSLPHRHAVLKIVPVSSKDRPSGANSSQVVDRGSD
jgi:hypothetical protein